MAFAKLLHPSEYSEARIQALKEMGITIEEEIKKHKEEETKEVSEMKKDIKEQMAKEVVEFLKGKNVQPIDMRRVISCAWSLVTKDYNLKGVKDTEDKTA